MSYGRNFEFRVTPHGGQRSGRAYLDESVSTYPIGAPVVLTDGGTENALGQAAFTVATGATNKPAPGEGGIAVYEYGPAGYAGDDPWLTDYSDKDTIPAAASIQVVSGPEVKVVLRNTEDETFLNTREYTGRVMVAGLGATLSLQVGDYLTPGTGDDDNGYWAETANADEAWLVITKVDNTRGEVEARLTF